MGHSHSQSSEKIGWAFFLNFGFTIIEFIGGWLTNSTAIMADAVHDLGDTLSIGSAWLLNKLGTKSATKEFTYGYRRLSLLGALINGIVLIVGSAWILYEAVPRLSNPEIPETEGMIALAILGVLVNGFAAYKLHGGKSLNEKVLNWHLLEDVLGWVAVLIVAIVMQFKDWPVLDPVLSIGFTLFILFNVIRNLISTVKLFFQASPDNSLLQKVTDKLLELDAVSDLHHLHIWSLDGEHHVATVHVVSQFESKAEYLELKESVSNALQEFELSHTTIEIELTSEECRDAD
ncbi:cation diffusion facilitator family transporter [Alteromonas sp. Cnat3-28]|uniref:cation diffusion facilitator family transporter n=1 Tax=Alteromonas sp. Cnat3-28 TaxID=2917729 RepID=UPI001EF4F428|nr:cation diffusion facilitator family transporter [Alteromonas sp. Cnat3-28]MCG7646766.1 cation diffusion facilitator family transporter [Alteromonas sp. Cnat3-28]